MSTAEVLAKLEAAEAIMSEEYGVWRRGWEANPTLTALAEGIRACRAARDFIEKGDERGAV